MRINITGKNIELTDGIKTAVTDKLSKLDQTELNSMFANGQNYYTFDVVVPPEEQLGLYGNKCFVQKNKLNSYDASF